MSAAQRDADTARAVPPAPEEPRKPFSWRFTTPLYLGSSLNPVNSSIIATALVPLAADLGLAVGATSVLVSSLYLASAVAQPTAGKLAEVLGARRVFLGGIVLVLLGGLARDLATLTVARVLIGLGTSAAFPCAMVLIRRRAEAARMTKPPGSVLGGVAVAGMATAAFGPPLGGLLVGAAGWRWAFLVNIPFTLLALLMTVRWLPADAPLDRAPRPLRRIAARVDLAGVLGFAASMTALVVFLMGLPHPSWPALAVFAAAAVPTVWWELRGPEPFFDLRALAANGALSRTYLRQALSLLGTYTVMFGVTQWTQDTYGMSALRTGLLLLPMGAVSALLSRPLAGRNLVRGPLVAAALSMLAGSAGILLLSSDSPVFVLVLVSLVFGVTTATTTVGNQTMLYVAAPPDRIGTASGLFRTFGYLGTITSSVIGGIVFRAGTSDGGLHTLGFVLVGAGLAVLLLTVLDRRLMRGARYGSRDGARTRTARRAAVAPRGGVRRARARRASAFPRPRRARPVPRAAS
ncbi:MFS transporter [Streptomyces sp. NPDC058426]|uniref:MFS transporter n=1 Tax=Streptomyces sp. NPDC058426 TaxID=3346493 RepID=UPI00365848FA